MANHYFLSYSTADAADFALRLAEAASRAAWAIISAAGIAGRAARLVDALAVTDAAGLLAPVRAAVSNSEVNALA